MKNLKDLWERTPELVDSIGGQQLSGSGFEFEEPDAEYTTVESTQEEGA